MKIFGKKITKNKINQCFYLNYYKKLPIDQNLVLLESLHGAIPNGNIFYILKELTKSSYADFKICVTIKENLKEKAQVFLQQNGIENVHLVVSTSREYYKCVASAKFLINDNTFLPFFIKKEGQVYLNTWHGTPLKTLGKKVNNAMHDIGNVQKNFVIADYLLYPNEYTMEHMVEDYMLNDIAKGKMLLDGYPRNTAFFDETKKAEIIQEQEVEGKQIIVYMPTWRGTVSAVNRSEQQVITMYHLLMIDKQLTDDQVMFVNLHPFAKNTVNYRILKHIRPFPDHYETYEFLNVADVLITDYSSVFFDFAITGRKIILFTYDEEEYLSDRGLYMDFNSLPFPKAADVNSLVKEIAKPKQYDDSEFIKTYCPYDSKDATQQICERVLLNKQTGIKELDIASNGKENVIIYTGNLAKNGITASIMGLLNNIDVTKRNYYLTFWGNKVQPHSEILATLPEGVRYFPSKGKMNLNLLQKIVYVLFWKRCVPESWMIKLCKDAFATEIKRNFGPVKFDAAIQFSGYETNRIMTFSQFDCPKTIYVHNDMNQEIESRGNQRRKVLEYAYDACDNIAVVTEDMIEPTLKFTSRKDAIKVVKNIIPYEEILEKGKLEVTLDEDTHLNVTPQRLLEVLNGSGKKFVTIGRYSVEKGHRRLIDAFQKVWKEHQDTYLVIIGGHGEKYQETEDYAASLDCGDHIILIRSLKNPYTVLSRCDYFVLSSFYEGFGIVLAEADILGKPVISTDIPGPKRFMEKHHGTLVENSEQGIYQGMIDLLQDKIAPMNVDYAAYNNEAIEEFEALFTKKG